VALVRACGASAPAGAEQVIDFATLARFPGTVAVWLRATEARHWLSNLMRAGTRPDTQVTVLPQASTREHVADCGRLDEVAERLSATDDASVLVIIGTVQELPNTDWNALWPLLGRRIMVTRPADQNADLADRLSALGAVVLVQPAIRIADSPDWAPVDEALARIASFDWLVFFSANGVRFLLDRLLSLGGDLRQLAGIRLAAIGPGTSLALSRYHLRADRQPTEFRAEALAEVLAAEARGTRFLLARASRGREVLAEQLRAAGGEVEQVVVYSSTDVDVPDPNLAEQLAHGAIDWITVTSSAIAGSLHRLFGEKLRRSRLASISPITSDALRQLGYNPAVEAREYTMGGLVEAILQSPTYVPPP
jgi:uroporphyrinogen III methyltransferase/synthase